MSQTSNDPQPRLEWRLATNADAPAIAVLVNGAYRGDSGRKGWTTEADLIGGNRTNPELVLHEIIRPDSFILLVHPQGAPAELIGCVHLAREGQSCYLGMLTVKPEAQKLGVGSFLMNSAESFVHTTLGLDRIHFGVIWTRKELIAWYERRGYQAYGETRPFPYGIEAVGLPLRQDLHFVMFAKRLGAGVSEPSHHQRSEARSP